MGYLRNGALDRKTFLVKVGWYEVYKTHIEFGAIPRDEGAKFGSLLKPVHLKLFDAGLQCDFQMAFRFEGLLEEGLFWEGKWKYIVFFQ